MQTPTFDGPQADSFSFPYASSLQNSQVLVKRRQLATLTRRAIVYPAPHLPVAERQPPFILVVSPNGHHGALCWKALTDVLDERGNSWQGRSGDVAALDEAIFLGGMALSWSGKAIANENNVDREAAARRIEGQRFAAVAAFPSAGPLPQSPSVGIQGGRRTGGTPGTDWIAAADGNAVAAIGADFTSVLALDAGVLQVWPPMADEQGNALLGAERHVGGAAKFISIVGPHIMLIVPDTTGGHLLAFTGDTTPVYSLPLPFEVLQPAIAGAKGRVYLAGKGLAALDHGKLTWAHLSEEPIYVSTFEDGSLAIATGKRLDLVKTDGSIDQTFNAEEPLVAPPAIASDGSIWAASATALYIAR